MPTDRAEHFVALVVAWCVGLAAIAGGMRAAWWIATQLLTGAKNLEFFVNMFPTFRVIAKEFQPNGGGSLKDQLTRVDMTVKRLEEGHVELHKGQEAAVLAVRVAVETAKEAKSTSDKSVQILEAQNEVLDAIQRELRRMKESAQGQ